MTQDSDRVYISVLLDTYGSLLTDKQREISRIHYDMDVSLGEIAAEYDISRQAVRDCLLKAEDALRSYEDALGMVKLKQNIHNIAVNAENSNPIAALKKIAELTEI